MRRILLGQLGANGDCLYATTLARQIRHDNPDAHITWAISSLCSGLLRNNPHIDSVWEVPAADRSILDITWRVFEREAVRRLLRHEFDHAYLSQIWPNNFQNYDGTIRPSILRSYGAPITVPVENVIRLDEQELSNIKDFAEKNTIDAFSHRILFECSAHSGQSFVTPGLAQEIAAHVYAALPSATVIFSTQSPMNLLHPNSRYAGNLSLRETAGLTHYCSLFVGAGSGGTVAATSTAAKQLPMIQLLSASTSVFASFAHDFAYYGLDHSHIVEMTQTSSRKIADAIVQACTSGIAFTQAEFGETIPVGFQHYTDYVADNLLCHRRYLDAAQSMLLTADRYGWAPELRDFAMKRIAPYLATDPGWIHAHRRQPAELLLRRLHEAPGKPATPTVAARATKQECN